MSTRAVLACAAATLLAGGCGAGGAAETDAPDPTPHGYVEGAEETAEAQWRLVMADAESTTLHMLDPATEEVQDAGTAPTGATQAVSDGRFTYFAGDDGQATAVFDSGAWTVDHGDHVHYYRAEAGPVGEVSGGPGLHANGDTAVTALVSDEGARVLDRAALEEGAVEETATVDAAAVVAYGGALVTAQSSGAVQMLDRDGGHAADLDADCPDLQGQAVTGRGAVLGCSDGALLITEADEESGGDDGTEGGAPALDTAKIAYPDGVDAVESFHHRPGTPVLAGRSGDGIAVLDIAGEQWARIDSGPVLAVSAAGEDMPVLALGDDGTLRSYDPATGEETASTDLMDPPADGAAPTIQIDTGRAYVNDAAANAVYEVDYNDDLRLARTFDLGFSPDLMVETGW